MSSLSRVLWPCCTPQRCHLAPRGSAGSHPPERSIERPRSAGTPPMRSCGATAPSPVRGRRRRRRSRVYGRCCRCAAFSPRESSSLEIASTSLDAAFAGVRLSKADLSRPISGHLAPPIGHPTGPRPAPFRDLHVRPASRAVRPSRLVQPSRSSTPTGSRPSYPARPSQAAGHHM